MQENNYTYGRCVHLKKKQKQKQQKEILQTTFSQVLSKEIPYDYWFL